MPAVIGTTFAQRSRSAMPSVRRTVLAVMMACVWMACGDDNVPVVPGDAGPRDAGRGDGGREDAGTIPSDGGDFDAGALDAGNVDGGATDAAVDAGALDATIALDASKDAEPGFDAYVPPVDGGSCSDLCPCPRPASACTLDAECGSTERCVETVCGEHVCEPAGAPCADTGDCAPGAACTDGVCVRPSDGCADSRDCAAGFECEAGACVDRRVACVESHECPRGYVCRYDASTGGFCIRFHRPCGSDAGCADFGPGAVCRDVDGDGDSECTRRGACVTGAECGRIEQCGVEPATEAAQCTAFGVCRTDADCWDEGGLTCLDLAGQGVAECARSGGCTGPSDCPPGQVCATIERDAPPNCVASPT